MRTLTHAIQRLFAIGGWAPSLVFSIHVVATRVFHLYDLWPRFDVPMHFAGGLAIAYFVSGLFRALPRDIVRSSRLVVLEAVLIGSLTATAAMVWEFAEFTVDRAFGTNVQVSLANAMQDMALGLAGAAVMIAFRFWQLRAGQSELREVAAEWLAARVN